MTRETILAKVQKLKNMADSAKAIGNEAEALAFAGKMKEMMDRHRLSMSEVELLAEDEQDPMGRTAWGGDVRKRSVWQEDLAVAICAAHDVRLLVDEMSDPETGKIIWQSNRLTFVGHQSDREIATWVFVTLRDWANKEGLRQLRRERARCKRRDGHQRASRGFYAAFLLGFTAQVSYRYWEEQEARKQEYGTASVALVHQRMAKVNDEVKGTTTAKKTSSPDNTNIEGRMAGQEAGRHVAIHGNRRIEDDATTNQLEG